jgi:hypothetical protein
MSDDKDIIPKTTSAPASDAVSISEGAVSGERQEKEVFATEGGAVDFRTVTWQRLIIILLKVQIATGVLSIPSALGTLGAVPGALIIVGWQVLNTCKSESRTKPHAGLRPYTKIVAYRHSLRVDRLPQQASALSQHH